MFAIVETGGKQYPMELGRYIDVELLDANVDSNITLDKVVMLVDGTDSKVGQPYLEDTTVVAKVMKHDKAKKVIVYKQRCKKGYRKKQGHRQQFTRIMVEEIAGVKFTPVEKTEAEKPAKKAPAKKKTEAKAEKTTITKKTPAKKTATKKAAPKAEEPKTEE